MRTKGLAITFIGLNQAQYISRHIWVFVVSMKYFWVVVSLQTSLLCIMGELAWGGTVAVAVGVSDK